MRLFRIIAAGFLGLITGCQARESKPAATQLKPLPAVPKLAVDTAKIAVFPFDKERDKYTFQVYDKELGESVIQNVKAASLTARELNKVAPLLKACIDEYNQAQEIELRNLRKAQPKYAFHTNNFLINLSSYKHQLIAVVNDKGEKVIWVNCFCDDYKINWHRHIVKVYDGGNCFFNVKINLTRQTWYDLMVNGTA